MADSPTAASATGALPRSEQFARYARESRDAARRAELFLQAAHLSEDIEGNSARAAQFYREALEADPCLQPALIALERIYLRGSDWKALYEVLGLHAEAMDSAERGQARAEIYRKMARLAAERLSEPELACVCYENLLENSPGEPEAVRYLMGRYEQAQDWPPLEALLSAQAEKVADPVERAELLRILADGLRFAAGRAGDSIGAYRQAFESDPHNRGAFRGLVAALDSEGRQEELRDLFAAREASLAKESAGPERDEELFGIRMELASFLSGGSSEDRKAAQNFLAAAASLRPHDPLVIEREAEIWLDSGDMSRAVRAYENLLAHKNLSPARRSDALLHLAQICEAHLGDDERAQVYLQEILQIHRKEPLSANLYAAQRLLAEILFGQESMEQARSLFGGLLEKTASEEKQAVCEYHLRLAQIEEALGARDDALGHLEAVLAVAPRFGRALADRARILCDLGRWEQALEAQQEQMVHLPPTAPGPETEAAQLRMARILEELGRFDQSVLRYEELLARNPDYLGAREGLGRVLRQLARPHDALPVFEALMDVYDASGDRKAYARVAEQAAGICEEQGERGRAKELYNVALERDDTRFVCHERLAIYAQQEHRWGTARDHLSKILSLLPPHTPSDLREQIARSLERAERNAFFEEHG